MQRLQCEGFSEPRSGIVGAPKELNLESRRDSLENPRSSIDVTKLRLVKSTEDDDNTRNKIIKIYQRK
jgi:hypothetical protein